MAQYVIYSIQEMIDVANGKLTQGILVAGPGTGYKTGTTTYNDEVQALNALTSNGWTLQFVKGFASGKEYYFTHA